MINDNPTKVEQKPEACPWCNEVPQKTDLAPSQRYRLDHKPSCYLYGRTTDMRGNSRYVFIPASQVEAWNTRAGVSEGVAGKASYETAHDACYVMSHSVHPDIVVLYFLALKSHWFEDPNNLFYGMREKAKAYLYKWVETGDLADDNTTLEIAVASKFREWLQSSWSVPSPSVRAGVVETEDAWTVAKEWFRISGARVPEAEVNSLAALISQHTSRVIETIAAIRQSSLWNANGYDAALTAVLGQLSPAPATNSIAAKDEQPE